MAQVAVPFEATFYFETANQVFNQADQAILETVLTYSQDNPEKKIIIQGHTDNRGSNQSNLVLSKERANSLMEQLIQMGISSKRLQVKAFGAKYPLYSNQYESGRKFNRRAEIFITNKEKKIYFTQLYKNNRLKAQMRPDPAQFVIKNPKKETFWTTEKGTKIYVPANAFKGGNNQGVTLQFREAYAFSDMLLYGLSTTSNQGLLTTGGMFELVAKNAQGKALELRPSKQIGVQVPTDTVLPEMQLYDLDTSSVAGNWNNPRPLRATAALMRGSQGQTSERIIMGHQVNDCPPLEALLVPKEEDRLKALEAVETARQEWLAYEIPTKKEYPTDSIENILKANKTEQTTINEAYISTCKNLFCRIGEVFQKKHLKMAAKEAATQKRTTLRGEQTTLEIELERLKKEALANHRLFERSVAEKRRLKEVYELAQSHLKKFQRAQVEMANFQDSDCYQNFPNMPDTLHPIANEEHRFAVYYYHRNLDSLQKYYPVYEPIIAQALYGVDTYQEALRKQKFNQYVVVQDFKSLQKYFPTREQEVCQRLYKVNTYKEALVEKRYRSYVSKEDFDALKREFPTREKEACQALYQVDNFKAAQQQQRNYRFTLYCQTYNLQKLQQEFPTREKEACQIMYGLDNYASVEKAKTTINLRKDYYRLQLTNQSLGSWKNLDYLRKMPDRLLLVQEILFTKPASLFREDYMIYSNTKAINMPSQQSPLFTKYNQTVRDLEHTLISYYAVDNQTVAFATTTFIAKENKECLLTYELLSVNAFKQRLKTIR
ncbi:MAG: OmpA family protein [Aureispira sp.]